MKLLPLLLLLGCPTEPSTEPLSYEPVCTEPTALPCSIVDLPQHDAVSTGNTVTVVEGNDWVETVDGRAGGFIDASDNPWLYLRFGTDGLEKVPITDLEALDSLDWDLAFHRFNVRLNSGTAGPSCVAGGPAEGSYDDLDLEEAQATAVSTEAFYDDVCAYIDEDPDVEGAPTGIPRLALQRWWTYPHCVSNTGIPFVVRLASGRLLKLEILAYYGSNQDLCNTEGQAGADAALYTLKWTYLH